MAMHWSTSSPIMSSDHHQILAETMVGYTLPNEDDQSYDYFDNGSSFGSMATSYLPSSTSGDHVMTDAPPSHGRDQILSRNQHREAEKQRRKRINSHLDKLRNLLPSSSKTDKATLLSEVVQHIKQLKQQSLYDILPDQSNILPSESDEISVQPVDSSSSHGPAILKASLCCEDRANLLPELMETFKSLRLRILHAEMATLGGRLRSELLLVADDGSGNCGHPAGQLAIFLRNAFRTIVEKQNSGGRCRRFLAK